MCNKLGRHKCWYALIALLLAAVLLSHTFVQEKVVQHPVVVSFSPHPDCEFAGSYAEVVFPNHLTVRRSWEDASNIEILRYVKIAIKREHFLAIAELQRLFVLDLTDSTFKQEDLLCVRSCGNLNVVILDGTNISDNVVDVLEQLQGLASVSVVECQLSDEALVRIARIPSMKSIAIGKRDIRKIYSSPSLAPRIRIVEDLGRYYTLPPTIL